MFLDKEVEEEGHKIKAAEQNAWEKEKRKG